MNMHSGRVGSIRDYLELIYYVQFFVASVGIVIGIKDKLWGPVFTAIAVAGMAASAIFNRAKEKRTLCLNPLLTIDRDVIEVDIGREERRVRRRITLRAKRKIDRYLFRFHWTGATRDVVINCDNCGGVIMKHASPLPSRTLHWQLCELKFEKALERGQTRNITLEYTFAGAMTAQPYLLLAYTHVWSCEELSCNLNFAENAKPRAVYMFRGDHLDVAFDRKEIIPVMNSGKYVVETQPIAGQKLSIEWEY